jgi:hypothetical protein
LVTDVCFLLQPHDASISGLRIVKLVNHLFRALFDDGGTQKHSSHENGRSNGKEWIGVAGYRISILFALPFRIVSDERGNRKHGRLKSDSKTCGPVQLESAFCRNRQVVEYVWGAIG